MDDLSFDIFVVPLIALTLVIILYLHFFRKVLNKQYYQNFIVTAAFIAFVLNFIWEISQGPLYENFQYDFKHISFCALASIADMLMVLALLFLFALIYKNIYWIRHLRSSRVIALIIVGCLGAILSEMWHTSRGDWSYADTMPILPIVEVGVSPILQFSILPWLNFVITKRVIK